MIEEITTFENLPKMMATLLQKVEGLYDRLDSIIRPPQEPESKLWLNVSELQAYLPSHPKRQTIYSWTSSRLIPFHKKGRSIMFDKNEIDAWLLDSEHMKSISDLEREANDFVKNKHLNTK